MNKIKEREKRKDRRAWGQAPAIGQDLFGVLGHSDGGLLQKRKKNKSENESKNQEVKRRRKKTTQAHQRVDEEKAMTPRNKKRQTI